MIVDMATEKAFLGPLVRTGRTLAIMLLVVTSLLAFPSILPWMIAFWLVWHTVGVSRGQPGISTKGGFERLSRVPTDGPPPQVVVLELGGHDYLKGFPRAATKENLIRLVEACQDMGADVALMEIPRGFMSDPYWGLEREIAHEKDLALISDSAIRQLVLWSPVSPPGMWCSHSQLSDDGIHSNPRGSAFLARHVAKSLERMYGGAIRH